VRPRMLPAAHLSPCAANYLKAQYNPFADFDEPPCIPDLISTPSLKKDYRVRGTFDASGTDGQGWIVFNPYIIASTALVAGAPTNPDYIAPIWTTKVTTTAGADLGVLDNLTESTYASATVGHTPHYLPSEWGADALNWALQNGRITYRLVGAGLRVQYIGPSLYRAGNYVLYEDVCNGGELGQGQYNTVSTLTQDPATTFTAITNDEVAVTWHPRQALDLSYIGDYVGSLGDLAKYPVLAVAVSGTNTGEAPHGQYQFECVVHVELQGMAIQGKTTTHADPVGFAAVNSKMDAKPSSLPPAQVLRNKAGETLQNVKESSGNGKSYEGPLKYADSYAYDAPFATRNSVVDPERYRFDIGTELANAAQFWEKGLRWAAPYADPAMRAYNQGSLRPLIDVLRSDL